MNRFNAHHLLYAVFVIVLLYIAYILVTGRL